MRAMRHRVWHKLGNRLRESRVFIGDFARLDHSV
jgi:hypothetical protein